jgi:hypothetical protein
MLHAHSARLLCAAALAATFMLALASLGAWPFRGGGGGAAGRQLARLAAAAAGGSGAAAVDWSHPLFSRVDADLRPFSLSGISQQMASGSAALWAHGVQRCAQGTGQRAGSRQAGLGCCVAALPSHDVCVTCLRHL